MNPTRAVLITASTQLADHIRDVDPRVTVRIITPLPGASRLPMIRPADGLLLLAAIPEPDSNETIVQTRTVYVSTDPDDRNLPARAAYFRAAHVLLVPAHDQQLRDTVTTSLGNVA